MTSINSIFSMLLDDKNWTLQKSSKNVHAWTRKEVGTPLHSIRVAALLKGPIENVCAVSSETDLWNTWLPGIQSSRSISDSNKYERITECTWKMPMLSAREILMKEQYFINDEDPYLLIWRQTPKPSEVANVSASHGGKVHADIVHWSSVAYPVAPNHTFLVGISNLDLKMPLPEWLVNYVAVKAGYKSMVDLQLETHKSLCDPESPFAQRMRMNENRAFYDRVRQLALTKAGRDEGKNLSSLDEEIMSSAWVKDIETLKRWFGRFKHSVQWWN
eukprot:gnl/MRDRNA2_/MRDRNA2_77636_c0_seq3.p1 gnl/MRDRNA2_/MRDRNA2_77636_c0~~gnl/MRDRNA2_/MRDRNA2_77636_c0_seq3.p1  ORF type:complete len:274 (+),score=31.02 gnl/MRDRNA2_/MRDRNA2_77636_c0_seq3:183-1004(+)